jgi:hypothetical protein
MQVKRTFDPEVKLGFDNLVVSGCSFTHQFMETSTSWPYYLKDLAGFDELFSCALSGAGNYHISQSVIWTIENLKPDPAKTLVAVMWSGYDRDDDILDASAIDQEFPWAYRYTDTVYSGMTGGSDAQNSWSNVKMFFFRDLAKLKSKESRAVENSIWMISLKRYLDALGYQSVFMHYLDRTLPSRTNDFRIDNLLPKPISDTLKSITDAVQDPYSFCLKRSLLSEDDFHPTPDGYLSWTREVLIPHLKSKYSAA